MEQRLLNACSSSDLDQVDQLLKEGADACYQDAYGRSPLMTAAQAGHVAVIERLLAEGVKAELLLGALERRGGRPEEELASASYLDRQLVYDDYRQGGAWLMDTNTEAVMMAWEAPLMAAHAQAICSRGGDILNVGFGLGIVDTAIQGHSAALQSHTIVEAHPDVYARMKADGWDQKPGVRIIHARWQDVIKDIGSFDGIFFDTYSEYYDDLRTFHSHLPHLLKTEGLYSFFNGLAADNPFFHAVYCELVQRELARLGFCSQYIRLPINVSDKRVWEGVGNLYWQLDTYHLPVIEWDTEPSSK